MSSPGILNTMTVIPLISSLTLFVLHIGTYLPTYYYFFFTDDGANAANAVLFTVCCSVYIIFYHSCVQLRAAATIQLDPKDHSGFISSHLDSM